MRRGLAFVLALAVGVLVTGGLVVRVTGLWNACAAGTATSVPYIWEAVATGWAGWTAIDLLTLSFPFLPLAAVAAVTRRIGWLWAGALVVMGLIWWGWGHSSPVTGCGRGGFYWEVTIIMLYVPASLAVALGCAVANRARAMA